MKKFSLLICTCLLAACITPSYTLKSKKSWEKATPPASICDRIVEFRIEKNCWPISKPDFMSKGMQYYNAFKDFPYQTIEFRIADSLNMTFFFFDHKDDFKTEDEVDINPYGGHVNFYYENGTFLWKLTMNKIH